MTGRLARMVVRMAAHETQLCVALVTYGLRYTLQRARGDALERERDQLRAKVAELEGKLDEMFEEMGGGRA